MAFYNEAGFSMNGTTVGELWKGGVLEYWSGGVVEWCLSSTTPPLQYSPHFNGLSENLVFSGIYS